MRDFIVYQKENYNILMIRGRYIVVNVDKVFKEGHTHLKSFKMAKRMIDYCINKEIPKVNTSYLIISAIRLTDDEEYKSRLEGYLVLKKDREKNRYYNINRYKGGCKNGK